MHKDYLYHLFDLFKNYTFHEEPYIRHEVRGPRKGLIKSYSFRTFTHTTFGPLRGLFMGNEKKKIIIPNLILNHLTAEGLAYWIMDDGSLNNKTMIIHTQSYSHEEVMILSYELNKKFNLNSRVIPHKKKYWVILIPSDNFELLSQLILPFIHPSMGYKLNK